MKRSLDLVSSLLQAPGSLTDVLVFCLREDSALKYMGYVLAGWELMDYR